LAIHADRENVFEPAPIHRIAASTNTMPPNSDWFIHRQPDRPQSLPVSTLCFIAHDRGFPPAHAHIPSVHTNLPTRCFVDNLGLHWLASPFGNGPLLHPSQIDSES